MCKTFYSSSAFTDAQLGLVIFPVTLPEKPVLSEQYISSESLNLVETAQDFESGLIKHWISRALIEISALNRTLIDPLFWSQRSAE